MTTTTAFDDWTRKIAEANDAIGAARDALNHAKTANARRLAAADLGWWIGRKAFCEAAREEVR